VHPSRANFALAQCRSRTRRRAALVSILQHENKNYLTKVAQRGGRVRALGGLKISMLMIIFLVSLGLGAATQIRSYRARPFCRTRQGA